MITRAHQILAGYSDASFINDMSLLLMQAMARFMGKIRGDRVTFDPDRIVLAGGATGASELLMCCLADPGDAFLVPTPYYPA